MGMTQYIRPDGRLVPVTALEAGPCIVTDLRNEKKHGYKELCSFLCLPLPSEEYPTVLPTV